MSIIKFVQGDCLVFMDDMAKKNRKVDVILTSPPYNTGRPTTSEKARKNNEARYNMYMDNMLHDDYCNWCVNIFNKIDKVLKENGVVLWQVSYGNDATVNTEGIGLMWNSISDIIRNTNFTVADRIIWHKKSALPNNVSPNKLTRIVEDVFVFCRKDEFKTFKCNKEVSSISKRGQTFYKPIYNYIEAPNNDGSNNLNKATYSSDLCVQLLNIYAQPKSLVMDIFSGTGTTGIACEKLGLNHIGIELSEEQVEYSNNRLKEFREKNND